MSGGNRAAMSRLPWIFAGAWALASACGGKAVVDGTIGSGGAGGTLKPGVLSTNVGTAVSSTVVGTPCADVLSCSHCSQCVTGCGVPANANQLCQCNDVMGKSSRALYSAYFGCLCGDNGGSGKCGSKCSKTCNKTGMDAPDCMSCLASAVSGSCFQFYSSCNGDK